MPFNINVVFVKSWPDDSHIPDCSMCYKPFTKTKRRHHCRTCSALVCNDCSPEKRVIPVGWNQKNCWITAIKATEERLCTECAPSFKTKAFFQKLQEEKATDSLDGGHNIPKMTLNAMVLADMACALPEQEQKPDLGAR